MRHLPVICQPRLESGPVKMGDDWPGIFIRGDNAMALAMECRSTAAHGTNEHKDALLARIAELMDACVV